MNRKTEIDTQEVIHDFLCDNGRESTGLPWSPRRPRPAGQTYTMYVLVGTPRDHMRDHLRLRRSENSILANSIRRKMLRPFDLNLSYINYSSYDFHPISMQEERSF